MKNTIYLLFLICCFGNCVSQEKIDSISTIELRELLTKEKIQLLDVRTPKEVKQGYIKSAKFVNYFDYNFAIKTSKIIDKNKPVYLYCRSGNRSKKACSILKEQDYKVINVLGGYTKWKKENTNETNSN